MKRKIYIEKILDLFEMNNFAFLRFFRISHIIVEKYLILDFQ